MSSVSNLFTETTRKRVNWMWCVLLVTNLTTSPFCDYNIVMKLTQRQINFTQDYFNEVPPGQAYMTHFKVKSMSVADVCASKLLKTTKIQTYLEELRAAARSPLIMDYQERQKRLTEIGRGNLLDYQEVGADGGYLSIGRDSPNTGAISEITSRTEYDKDGANAALITKVKLHSPISAIDILNKMDKVYNDVPLVNQDNRTINIIVSSEKAKELIESVGKRLLGGDDVA